MQSGKSLIPDCADLPSLLSSRDMSTCSALVSAGASLRGAAALVMYSGMLSQLDIVTCRSRRWASTVLASLSFTFLICSFCLFVANSTAAFTSFWMVCVNSFPGCWRGGCNPGGGGEAARCRVKEEPLMPVMAVKEEQREAPPLEMRKRKKATGPQKVPEQTAIDQEA